MLLTQQDDFHGSCSSFMGGLDEIFWCSHLRRLINIGNESGLTTEKSPYEKSSKEESPKL